MAETAQTMTEFTYAPGEKNIVGDRFSPSVIIFWLKTSIAASSTRVQYKAPEHPVRADPARHVHQDHPVAQYRQRRHEHEIQPRQPRLGFDLPVRRLRHV